MARQALFSYEGALRVLGSYQRPWLDRADVFLGVSILVGGVLEPDVLSLVDPKNEATASLRKILDGITDKLTGLSGTHRHDLIAAAHTIIAVTSVFEALRDEIGADFDKLKITDREKFRILGAEPPDGRKEVSALPSLTSTDVPAPSATCGFHENLADGLDVFFSTAVAEACQFITGLEGAPARLDTIEFVTAVRDRAHNTYKHHYLGLAAAIPEFEIWAMLGEHAATRAAISESLELFSTLLARLPAGQSSPSLPYRTQLRTVAEGILAKPLLRSARDTSSINAVFPTVEKGFVAPAYRLAVYGDDTDPSSEQWWLSSTHVREELDTFLAAHLAGQESTERPLLVLGNPGAGKSLLMEVLASRLPSDRFAVVTVQLRKVRAQDRVQAQIETALHEVLGKRVDWGHLADECGDAVTPVVLLDGFDELVQAGGVHHSTYLQLVQEFQELQADRGRPVAVVVTSRVLVADRASIPARTPIVMLEEFDDGRIDRWLGAWNTANERTSGFRPMRRELLGQHVELARQPLLLLMLVIYEADPGTPPLDSQNLSNAELYRRLIGSFVLRQVSEKSPVPLPQEIIERRTEESWWRLGIAAFAMFNRGHQYVTAAELNRDLGIFAPSEPGPSTTLDTPVDDADRTVENFFFIHSPTLNDGNRPDRRTYEFLHATFSEYLIADVTVQLLLQMAAARALPAANPYQRTAPPDNSLLYALTSHQVFVKREPIVAFAQGLFSALPQDTRAGVLHMLDELIRSFHDRALSDPHPAYKPSPTTVVSRIANYSANLVCLRVLLDETPTPVESLFPQDDDAPLASWRATVHLWKSGLDAEGWDEVLDSITLVQRDAWYVARSTIAGMATAEQAARLLGDAELEGMLRTGSWFVGSGVTSDPQEQLLLSKLSHWLVGASGSGGTSRAIPYDLRVLSDILDSLDAGVRLHPRALAVLGVALSREAPRTPRNFVERGLRHLVPRTPADCEEIKVSAFELISTICAHPDLIGRGAFPVDLLPHLFEDDPSEAMSSWVLAWATLNSADRRVDDAFRKFVTEVAEAAAPRAGQMDDNYLPVDAFEYLARPRSTEPTIDERLITILTNVVHTAADSVRPQTILDLIERFRSHVPEKLVNAFASRYLSGRTVEDADDLERLSILRQMVQDEYKD